MNLATAQDIFSLSSGDVISKRELFDLIRFSKVAESPRWAGEKFRIGNTPQQGINWIGQGPDYRGVIIKARPGSYADDGWIDDRKFTYRYSFKARDGVISYTEKANQALIDQPLYQYPIFLFLETHLAWKFMGVFSVSEIQERCVVLNRGYVGMRAEMAIFRGEMTYHEGGKRFVSHLMAERNAAVVNAAKQKNEWVCEICDLKFEDRYGVSYIEGHHKIPISTYSSTHVVRSEDIALLCPNCHRAVHILMRREELSYRQIREILRVNE